MIYEFLYKYITLYNIVYYSSIVLLLLVVWEFWGPAEPRNTVLTKLSRRKDGQTKV